MEEFKQGDVVQLKSGGPTMTVVMLNEGGRLEVTFWNKELNKFEDAFFLPVALKKYKAAAF